MPLAQLAARTALQCACTLTSRRAGASTGHTHAVRPHRSEPVVGSACFPTRRSAFRSSSPSQAQRGSAARCRSIVVFATMSSDVPSLVSPAWLKGRLAEGGVKVLDGTWYMPNAGKDPVAEFMEDRIPGASFFDLDSIADPSSGLPHMLPSSEMFSAAVDAMGITNETHVVVYDRHGVFSAPRVWWTFRTMGHSKVSVLEGGLPAWKASGGDVDSSVIKEEDKVKLGVTPALSASNTPAYRADRDEARIRNLEQMWENINKASDQVVDARSSGRFYGTAPEPREGMRGGHIPGSKSVPFDAVLTEGKAGLKSPTELKNIFEEAGIVLDSTKPIVASCGSGMTACVLALALDQIGQPLTCVYDGSWTEWGSNQDVPIVKD